MDRSSICSSDSPSSSKSSKSLGPRSSSSSSSSNISCNRRSAFFFCCDGILNLKPVSSARCSMDVKSLLWRSLNSSPSSVERSEAALSLTGHLKLKWTTFVWCRILRFRLHHYYNKSYPTHKAVGLCYRWKQPEWSTRSARSRKATTETGGTTERRVKQVASDDSVLGQQPRYRRHLHVVHWLIAALNPVLKQMHSSEVQSLSSGGAP